MNAINIGVGEENAVRAATCNPACAIGAQNVVGSIEEGKVADFVICSDDYKSRRVFLAGEKSLHNKRANRPEERCALCYFSAVNSSISSSAVSG